MDITMEKDDIVNLIKHAENARKYSYAPYSGYLVGAALLTGEGSIVTGCNIENAAYTPSTCAERTAFMKAVSDGIRHFRAIAIVGGKKDGERDFAYPCGVCRQVMAEFCCPEAFSVIVAKSPELYKVYTLAELLPESFGAANLSVL